MTTTQTIAHACEPHAPGTTACTWCRMGFERVDLDAVSFATLTHGTLLRIVAELREHRQWRSAASVIIDWHQRQR